MRKHYIDWLRIIAILLLFPFHTARVFDHWETNYVKDVPNWFSSWFLNATSFWFMPLLFLFAGISSWYALSKRSAREYRKERVSRLLIPLIVGLLLIVPPQAYIAKLHHFGYTGSYLDFLGGYFFDFHDISGYTGGFTPAHLLFILYLFVISVALLPLLFSLKRKFALLQAQVKLGFLARPWVLLLSFIPLTLTEALPSIGGKNPFYFAAFFLLGYVLACYEGFFETLRKIRLKALIVLAIAAPGYYIVSGLMGWPSGYNLGALAVAFMRNLACVLALAVLLGYGEKFLNRDSAVLRYLNRAAFPVYVLHQTVLVVIAYFVVQAAADPAVKFLAIMLSTLIACFALYEVFRRFRATRWLFGIK